MRIRRLLGGATVVAVLAAAPAPALAQGDPVPVCDALGTPCKLSIGLDDARVIDSEVAPNGERVVLVHRGENGPVELYSARITGGSPPVKLSLPSNKHVALQAISPDSKRVLYTLPAGTGQPGDAFRTELYSVPIAGPVSAAVRLAADVNTSRHIKVSPDSVKVVFAPPVADRLRVVPVAGPASATRRLTDPFVAGATVGDVRISADSRSVVYRADQETDGKVQLYRVPLTLTPEPDPPTTRLNGPLEAGGDVGHYTLAPDNGPVVYMADEDTDGVNELYRVKLGGAERAKLNRTLPPGWNVMAPGEGLLPGRITPDGRRVVYEIGAVVANRVFRELYSVPIAGPGSASVRLDHPPLIPPGEIAVVRYKLSDDSRRVVYTMVDQRLGEPNLPTISLVSVPVAGPASAGQVLTFPATEDFIYAISPDGQRVAYLYPGTPTNLYSVRITGGGTVRLNGTESVGAFLRINLTSTRIVYNARTDTGPAMFSAALDGNGARYNLTESLDGVWDVTGEALSPNGARVVYKLRRGGLGSPIELFSSRLTPAIVPPTP